MIDFTKYNLDDDDIAFILEIKDSCINDQNEIILAYKGKSFVLEPRAKAVRVYAYGKDIGDYDDFDELLMNHKIDGKPLIDLVKDLEYGE